MEMQPNPDELCGDYQRAAKWYYHAKKEQSPVPADEASRIRDIALRKAAELGYKADKLRFDLVAVANIYIAFLYPQPLGERIFIGGGDLLIVIEEKGSILCFHRGA